MKFHKKICLLPKQIKSPMQSQLRIKHKPNYRDLEIYTVWSCSDQLRTSLVVLQPHQNCLHPCPPPWQPWPTRHNVRGASRFWWRWDLCEKPLECAVRLKVEWGMLISCMIRLWIWYVSSIMHHSGEVGSWWKWQRGKWRDEGKVRHWKRL